MCLLICKTRKVVEDEYHFVLSCKNNETLTQIIFKDIAEIKS